MIVVVVISLVAASLFGVCIGYFLGASGWPFLARWED